MRLLTVTLGVATLAAALAAPTPAAAQREGEARARTPRPSGERRAEPLVRAFTSAMLQPDRAVVGITLGEAGTEGIRVDEVAEGGPAAQAGIRVGDRITAVGDVSLRLSAADLDDPVLRTTAERRLRRALEAMDAGEEVTLRVATGDGERTVRVRTVRADSLAPRTTAQSFDRLLPTRMRDDRASLGLSLSATGTVRDTLGAFVSWVAPGSPAEEAGVYEGMRIAAINDVSLRVPSADTGDRTIASARVAGLERELDRLTAGDEVTLRVWADGRYRDVRVRTAKASEVFEGTGPWGAMLRTMPGGVFQYTPRGGVRVEPGMRTYTIPSPRTRVQVAPGAPGRLEVITPGTLRRTLPRVWYDDGMVELDVLDADVLDADVLDIDVLDADVRERVRERVEEARRRADEARTRGTRALRSRTIT